MIQILAEAFPPRPQWTADNVPDMTGKVVAVTGGYGGIGYHTVVSRPPPSFESALKGIGRKHCWRRTPRYTSSDVMNPASTPPSNVSPKNHHPSHANPTLSTSTYPPSVPPPLAPPNWPRRNPYSTRCGVARA